MYRGIILTIAGLALVGAGEPPKQSARPEQSKEQREISSALKDITATLKDAQKPDQTTKPCDPAKPDRNSDLCAQWHAADSATNAAKWSYWQLIVGWLGLLLGLITMIAAIAAALYAKAAAEGTQVSAQSYIWSERAWLEFIHWPKPNASIEATPIHAFPNIEVRNSGKSVAKIVRVTAHEVDNGWKKIGCETEWPAIGRLIKAGSTATLRALPISLDVDDIKKFVVNVEYAILGGETDSFECRFSMSLTKSMGSMGGFILKYSE